MYQIPEDILHCCLLCTLNNFCNKFKRVFRTTRYHLIISEKHFKSATEFALFPSCSHHSFFLQNLSHQGQIWTSDFHHPLRNQLMKKLMQKRMSKPLLNVKLSPLPRTLLLILLLLALLNNNLFKKLTRTSLGLPLRTSDLPQATTLISLPSLKFESTLFLIS